MLQKRAVPQLPLCGRVPALSARTMICAEEKSLAAAASLVMASRASLSAALVSAPMSYGATGRGDVHGKGAR